MRRHVIPLLGVVLLTVGTASLLIAQTPDSAEIMFEAARQMELIDGDLEAAIGQYAAIESTYPDRRAIVAHALLRMGSAYEKLGQARARGVYERLVREYADQTMVLTLAREGLSRLTVEPTPASPTMTVRELMRSGERGEVPDPASAPTFAISGDGQTLVYTEWATGDLAVRNMATGEVRSLYGVDWVRGPAWFEAPVLSPDDKKVAYVRFPSRTGDSTRIDVDSIEGGHLETVYDFKESTNSYPYDWSPDGETILISSRAADRSVFLATVSLKDKTLQRLVTLNWEGPRRAQYSPDGRFIAYDSTKGDDRKIYLISADGSQERVLVDSPGEDDSPLWTRDGRFLLFRSDRSGKWDLYAHRIQNGQPTGREVLLKANLGEGTFLRGLTTEGRLGYFEQFGGRDIAITERIEGPAKTAQVRILPKVQTPENRRPSFAPDGKRLAYLAGTRQSGTSIRITDLEGKILREIPLESRFNIQGAPMFSPDGKKMALRVYDAGEAKIMVRSAETGALLNVFSTLEEEGYSSPLGWSRDSRLLHIFVTLRAGGRSLDTINPETEEVVESTVLSKNVGRAWLSPSGEYLAMLGFYGEERATQLVLRSMEDGSENLLTEGISPFIAWDFDSRHLFYRKVEAAPARSQSPSCITTPSTRKRRWSLSTTCRI